MRLLLFSTFISLATISSFAQSGNPQTSKIAPELIAAFERGETTDFIVVMREQADVSAARWLKNKSDKAEFVYQSLLATATRTQQEARAVLKNYGARANSFYVVNAISVNKGTAMLAYELAALSEVKSIAPDPWQKFPGPVATPSFAGDRNGVEWGIDRINAPEVWALGYNGQGITVGGADTGYDWVHPAIQPHYRGWNNLAGTADHNYNWHDAIHDKSPLNADSLNPCGFNAVAPCDDNAHGTHTMGTMTGDDGMGNQIGVAPGAQWVGCRNMERGWGQPSTYIECFEWFLAPTDLNGQNANPAKAPHVINNSWYCADMEGCDNPDVEALMRQAVINLRQSGVVVVVSNGNNGPWCGSASEPPAYFEESFSVGSTRFDDTISSFSSRGPVLTDGSNRLKPNVAAPGQDVRSCTPNGNFSVFSGTSMAGPHVVGLVALVLSARPDLAGQVDLIEDIIEQTAVQKADISDCGVPAGTIPNMAYGMGRVDALAAVNLALSTINTDETVTVPMEVQQFPNPVEQNAWLSVRFAPQAFDVTVSDAEGRVISAQTFDAKAAQLVPLALENAPRGIYFWKVVCGNQTFSGKMVKS